MLSILAKILGSGDVVRKGMELIDSLHTSTEEELQAKAKAKTDLLTAYQPFKLAQRYLALMFASTFLSSFLLILCMTLAGIGDTTAVVSRENVAKDLGLKNYEETFEVDAGVCKVYLYSCLRITYMEFNDGRTGSSAVSKL